MDPQIDVAKAAQRFNYDVELGGPIQSFVYFASQQRTRGDEKIKSFSSDCCLYFDLKLYKETFESKSKYHPNPVMCYLNSITFEDKFDECKEDVIIQCRQAIEDSPYFDNVTDRSGMKPINLKACARF